MKSSYAIYLLFFLSVSSLWARLPTEVEGNVKRKYWQFIFLFDTTTAADQTEYNINPFYGHYKNYEKAYDYRYFLYPVFYAHGTNYWKRWSLLYLLNGDDFYHKDTGEDTDFTSPFVVYGSGKEKKENYFALFPIIGTVKNIFGFDELTCFLCPIVYTGWKYKDYQAHAILWPLTMYGSSKKRSDFRFLPFFSSKVHKGKYKRKSFLWPIFQWGSLGLDKKTPRHYFIAWPFGSKWSDDDKMYAWTFLWLPIIGSLVSYGQDEVREEVDFSFFFFLFRYQRSEDPGIRKTVVFPFYAYYRFGNLDAERQPFYKEGEFYSFFYSNLSTYSSVVDTNYKHASLVSLYFYEFFQSPSNFVFTPKYYLLTYWDLSRYYHREREEERYFKIWPLFMRYKDNTEGRKEFNFLSLAVLWPTRSDQFDKSWSPFSLIEYKQYENEDQYLSFFFRLYSQYWNHKESHFFLAGIEWHNTPEYNSFEILGGLFGIHRYVLDKDETDWAFEFLWIDFSRPEEIDEL